MESSKGKPYPSMTFSVRQDFHGPLKVQEMVKMYSHNKFLKLLGVRSWKYVMADLESQEIRVTEEKELLTSKPQAEHTFKFEHISSIRLDLKQASNSNYYLIITLDDGTFTKFKFYSLKELRSIVETLRGVVTSDGRPLMAVKDDYLTLKEHHHKGDQSSDISSEEDTHVARQKTVSHGHYEDENLVRERQEKDDEYAYLKWKFIEQFEPFGSKLPPERLMVYYNHEHGLAKGQPKTDASLQYSSSYLDKDEIFALQKLDIPLPDQISGNQKHETSGPHHDGIPKQSKGDF